MNCDAVRRHLLEESTESFTVLDEHLDSCPSCAELAASVRLSGIALTQHLEDFMHSPTLDTHWEAASAAVGSSRWTLPIRPQTAVVGLAAAAVLLLALSRGTPPVVPDPPVASASVSAEELAQAEEARERFEALDTTAFDADGLDRKAEDSAMRDLLQAKAAAMVEAETAYVELAGSDHADVQLQGWLGLAELHDSMAHGLRHFTHPSYLTEEQSAVYAMALEDKAHAQEMKALEAWERAAALADELGDRRQLTKATKRAGELRVQHEATQRELHAIEVAGRAAEPALRRSLADIETLGACEALDEAQREELQMMGEQAHQILEARAFDLMPDMDAMLTEVLEASPEACR